MGVRTEIATKHSTKWLPCEPFIDESSVSLRRTSSVLELGDGAGDVSDVFDRDRDGVILRPEPGVPGR
jgi:hypothetical protein